MNFVRGVLSFPQLQQEQRNHNNKLKCHFDTNHQTLQARMPSTLRTKLITQKSRCDTKGKYQQQHVTTVEVYLLLSKSQFISTYQRPAFNQTQQIISNLISFWSNLHSFSECGNWVLPIRSRTVWSRHFGPGTKGYWTFTSRTCYRNKLIN